MITYLRALFGFFVILLLTSFTVKAEDPALSFQTVQSCPPDVTIRKIMEDSGGFVWLGSDNYVYRFDGVHIVPYPLVHDDSDKVILVSDIVETREGKIIVATDSGLFSMEESPEGHMRAHPFLQDKIPAVKSLSIHPDGYLLIATPTALWSYSLLRGTLTRILIDRDPLSLTNRPYAMTDGDDGVYVISGDGGIYKIEKNFRVTRKREPVKDFPQPSGALITAGTIWIPTETDGLWKIDSAGNAAKIQGVEANVVTSLSVFNDSTLFAGTDGSGVFEINPTTGKVRRNLLHRPGSASSLQSNQIYSLMTDKEKRLWVGHYQRGADHTEIHSPGISILAINREDKAARTITILPDKKILVGTRAGMYFLSPDGKQILKNVSRPALRSNMVISTAVVGDTIYAGTYGGGMSILNASTGNIIPGYSPLPENMNASHVFSISPQPRTGAVWIGTSKGLFRLYKGKTTRFTSENSPLPAGNVYTIFFDSSGKGWIGTEEGLAIWDPALGKLRTDCFPENFISHAKVRQIYEGKNHTLYFVLENGKIALSNIDMSEFSRPEIFDSRNFIIKAVAEDRFGFVWLATNHGLIRWDRVSNISVFGKDNGLPSHPFIHCVPAKDRSVIHFGNAGGLLSIDTDILSRFVSQPRLLPAIISAENNVCIDHFSPSADGNEFLVDFKRHSKKISLKLTTLTYGEPDNSKYEYRINNGSWIPMPPGYTITLHNVDYGRTTVFLRPVGDDNAATRIILDMPGRVSPWIWGSAIAVAFAVISVIIYRRIRRKRSGSDRSPHSIEETDGQQQENDGNPASSLPERSKYATIKMTDKECEEIMEKIYKLFKKEKPYTNPNLKIADLAKMAGISSHKLSYILSEHLNMGFYDLVNQYRIEEFKRLVKSGADQTLTLTAMSERAGFSSRSSFFRCFKKLEGITPGEYLKRNS